MIRKEMKYTDEQGAVLDALIAKTGDESYAQMVRRLIEQEAQRHGLVFPDNMPTKQETIVKAREARKTKR